MKTPPRLAEAIKSTTALGIPSLKGLPVRGSCVVISVGSRGSIDQRHRLGFVKMEVDWEGIYSIWGAIYRRPCHYLPPGIHTVTNPGRGRWRLASHPLNLATDQLQTSHLLSPLNNNYAHVLENPNHPGLPRLYTACSGNAKAHVHRVSLEMMYSKTGSASRTPVYFAGARSWPSRPCSRCTFASIDPKQTKASATHENFIVADCLAWIRRLLYALLAAGTDQSERSQTSRMPGRTSPVAVRRLGFVCEDLHSTADNT